MTATTAEVTPPRRAGWLTAWIPPAFADKRTDLVRWGFVGLFVRTVLLPIGISTDTLAVYWRAHVIAFDGELYRDYLINTGSHLIHAGWLWIMQPVMAGPDQLWTDPWWWDSSYALEQPYLDRFLARPDALRHIAILKLPYLLADVAAGVLLLWLLSRAFGNIAADRRSVLAKRAWIFWMLSPVGLYATMIFGRYESFPVVAVLAALLLFERDRPWWAAIVLGIGVTLRTYPVVLIPVFALFHSRRLRDQVAWSGVAIAPFVLTLVGNRLVAGSVGELAQASERGFADFWFAFRLQPPAGPGIPLLVVALLSIGLYLGGRQWGWWGAPLDRADLWRWFVITHLAVFATSQFNLHYLMWLTPAIALLLGRVDRRGLVPLHLLQVAGATAAVAVFFDQRALSGALGGLGRTATYLLPSFAGLGPGRAQTVGNVAWSVFVVATLGLLVPAVAAAVGDRASRQEAEGQQPG